jgi:hypothetical protein
MSGTRVEIFSIHRGGSADGEHAPVIAGASEPLDSAPPPFYRPQLPFFCVPLIARQPPLSAACLFICADFVRSALGDREVSILKRRCNGHRMLSHFF